MQEHGTSLRQVIKRVRNRMSSKAKIMKNCPAKIFRQKTEIKKNPKLDEGTNFEKLPKQQFNKFTKSGNGKYFHNSCGHELYCRISHSCPKTNKLG